MLLIFCDQPSSRLQYILAVLFKQVVSLPYELVNNKTQFQQHPGPKINYSTNKFSEYELWIQPHDLLFETQIQQQNIECFKWNQLTLFFKTSGNFPFDIFAASFYLTARYEEYLPHTLDKYGRFSNETSLAYKEDFLQLPLVNLWMKELVKTLQKKFSDFQFSTSEFRFIPTYDIDIAFAYKGKGIVRNIATLFLSMIKGEWSITKERLQVLNGKRKDFFDVYDWLNSLHNQRKLNPIYFFLLAEKRKVYDKNISPNNYHLKKLIKQISEKNKVGIHPSWQSGNSEQVLKKELNLLRKISGNKVKYSRQHYIKMKMPETYRLLLKNGIQEDYSMGYGSINGFRASIASPFYWYDLEKEAPTSLLIFPFCFMDANSFFEQHYSATQAAHELQRYHDNVKNVKGTLITIFHNHFITEQSQWIEWRNMYKDFLAENLA